jgi:hypothetical protein
MDKQEDRPLWIERIRHSRFGLTLAAFAVLIAGVASTTEAVDKIAIWLRIKPNALQLAKDDERARFSRELTKAAWHRMFVMQRYASTVKNDYTEIERNREWDRYVAILLEWNRDLMVNILSLEQHYGADKRNEFEYGIQPRFGQLHSCLVVLHRPSPGIQCSLSPTADIEAIEGGFAQLNNELYCFVSGLPDRGAKCVRY